MKVGDVVTDAHGTRGVVVCVDQERVYVEWSVGPLQLCEACDGTGWVDCWSPGGPCPTPTEAGCDHCGPCVVCNGSGTT